MLVDRWTEAAERDLAEVIGDIEERDPIAPARLHGDIAQTSEQSGIWNRVKPIPCISRYKV